MTTLPTIYLKKPRGQVAGDCGGCAKGAAIAKRRPRPRADIRAALITPTLGLGGAEQWIRALVTHTDPQRISWTVPVLNPAGWSPLIAKPVAAAADVFTIGQRFATQRALLHETLRDVDVVVTWGGSDYWPLPTDAPVVMVAHGSCKWTRDAVAQAMAGGAAAVVGVSEKATEAVRDLCGDASALTIWNGVDVGRLAVTRTAEAVRAGDWKIPTHWFADQRRFVGYLGRLSPEKNPEAVIEAVAQLPNYFYCVLIGDTGETRDRVVQFGRARLGERMIVVPAVDDVGNHLAALDCLIQVSPREGNSLTLVEAMLTGTPIVTTRAGAVDEFEAAARRTLFRDVPADPLASEVAFKIRRAVRQGRGASRVVAAQRFAERELTAAAMAQRWEELITTLADERKPRRRIA